MNLNAVSSSKKKSYIVKSNKIICGYQTHIQITLTLLDLQAERAFLDSQGSIHIFSWSNASRRKAEKSLENGICKWSSFSFKAQKVTIIHF